MLYHLESEMSLIGAMLLDNKIIRAVSGILDATDFYSEEIQLVYAEIIKITGPVDMVITLKALSEKGLLEKSGGAGLLSTCVETVTSPTYWTQYAEVILGCSQKRKLRETAFNAASDAEQGSTSAAAQCASLINGVRDIAKRGFNSETDIRGHCIEAMKSFSNMFSAGGGMLGPSTGFDKIDALTSGLPPQNLVVIGGRTSHGKTSLALQIGDCLVRSGKRVLFISLEMPVRGLINRIVSQRTNINGLMINQAATSLHEWQIKRVMSEFETLAASSWVIKDNSGLNIEQIESMIYLEHNDTPLDLVIVDYIQKIRPSHREKRYESLGRASATMYDIAKSLHIPVMLLSQLNQPERGSGPRRPRESDLRESGNIANDASIIWFVYRPGKDGKKVPMEDTEFIIVKNREGPCGIISASMVLPATKFYETKNGLETEVENEEPFE